MLSHCVLMVPWHPNPVREKTELCFATLQFKCKCKVAPCSIAPFVVRFHLFASSTANNRRLSLCHHVKDFNNIGKWRATKNVVATETQFNVQVVKWVDNLTLHLLLHPDIDSPHVDWPQKSVKSTACSQEHQKGRRKKLEHHQWHWFFLCKKCSSVEQPSAKDFALMLSNCCMHLPFKLAKSMLIACKTMLMKWQWKQLCFCIQFPLLIPQEEEELLRSKLQSRLLQRCSEEMEILRTTDLVFVQHESMTKSCMCASGMSDW